MQAKKMYMNRRLLESRSSQPLIRHSISQLTNKKANIQAYNKVCVCVYIYTVPESNMEVLDTPKISLLVQSIQTFRHTSQLL